MNLQAEASGEGLDPLARLCLLPPGPSARLGRVIRGSLPCVPHRSAARGTGEVVGEVGGGWSC